jgi:hypothetical protein
MIPLFDKSDEYLIANKPHLWLARLHIITPIGLLLLATTAVLSYALPLSTAIYPILIGACLVSIFCIAALLRFQYLYYNKNFTPRQLNLLFLVNCVNILLFLVIAIIIPCNLGQRVQSALDRLDFTDFSNDMRIAMIPAKDIAWIRSGALDSVRPGQFANQAEYADFLEDVKSNKFIMSALTELNFNNASAADSTVTAAADSSATDTSAVKMDSSKLAADSSAYPADSSKKMAADTTKKYPSQSAGSDFSGPKNDTPYLKHYNYSSFLLTLRGKSDEEIARIKSNILYERRRFDFPAYYGDSSRNSINDYYDVLNKQSLNLYSTKSFYSQAGVLLICLFILFLSLSQFSILSLSRNKYLILLLALLVFFGMGAAVVFSEFAFTWVFIIIGGGVIAVLGSMRILRGKARYGSPEAFCYYLLHFMAAYLVVIATCIAYVLLQMIVLGLFFGRFEFYDVGSLVVDRHEYKLLIVPVCIFLFLMYKVYYWFIKRVCWIGCLPKR